jgi:predicted metal-dependent hydrolase
VVAAARIRCNVRRVTHKSGKIAARVARFAGQELDARYLGYFDCFNQEQFYEAHDVLEDLWLLDRQGAEGDFYKALIQLAGAFVHLQKGRVQPSIALLKLSRSYLSRYPSLHHRLDLEAVQQMALDWAARLARLPSDSEPATWNYPKLKLIA